MNKVLACTIPSYAIQKREVIVVLFTLHQECSISLEAVFSERYCQGIVDGRELKLRCRVTSEYMATALKCLACERVRWYHYGENQYCLWKNFSKE